MKLSMWMLYDWLKPFNPAPSIESGRPILRNARHFSDEVQIERQNVYIGRELEFFPSGGNGIILVQGNDTIRLATDDYEAVFNSILRAFDFYNGWSDSLHEKVISGCTLQDLADDSQDVFGDPFFIQDSTYRISAFSKSFGPGSLDPDWDDIVHTNSMRMDRIAGINSLIIPMMKTVGPFVFEKGFFPYRSICQNVLLYKKHVGWVVVLEHEKPITQGRQHICDTFVQVVEFWMEQNEDKRVKQINTGLFLDLLDGRDVNRDLLARAFDTMDWQINDEYCVFKIACIDETSTELTYLAEAIERTLYGCCTLAVGLSLMVIANLRLRCVDEIIDELTVWMKKSGSFCGVSNSFSDIMQLRYFYEQAHIAANYGTKSAGQTNRLKDYSLAYALNVLKKENADTIRHSALEILRKYDRDHGTDFFETLRIYMYNERNQVKTAEQLYLHRNSLYYRINRILEITGLNLDNPETRLHILLSYQITDNG